VFGAAPGGTTPGIGDQVLFDHSFELRQIKGSGCKLGFQLCASDVEGLNPREPVLFELLIRNV
jgi:hypothetical protein